MRMSAARPKRRLFMRAIYVILALIVACVCGTVGTLYGAGQYIKIDYPASTVEGELRIAVTYTLWVPDGVRAFRGIIVHQHGAGMTASKEGCIGRLWRRSGIAPCSAPATTY